MALNKYSVIVYREQRTEVDVIVRSGTSNDDIIEAAHAKAEKLPDSAWGVVYDSMHSDEDSDIQKYEN
jgi:hypothetical protein